MKEAVFYEKLEEKKVKCLLCPWLCNINEGNFGVCGARKNIDGTLYSIIYGIISSMANDPIEKKPLYHFHPGTKVFSVGTYGCNMKCGHCQNYQISRSKIEEADKNILITPKDLVDLAIKNKSDGIAWTYNEPTIWYEYSYDGAKLAKQKGLYTVWVTNGYINIEPLREIAPFLDAYRVDIKGFTDDFYKKVAKINSFKPILESTIYAKKNLKLHVECVTNIIPTLNDDDEQLKNIAKFIKNELGEETPWHVTRFYPCLEFSHLPITPVETLEKAREIGIKSGLKHVYVGNVPGHKFGKNPNL